MAFVFRSKTSNIKPTLTPGPGQYRLLSPKTPSHLATAPFNQTSPRKIWQESSIPGPGAYEVEEPKPNERAIVKTCGNTFGLFETPIESAIFKSHSKRFQNSEESMPGPGQYSVEIEKKPAKQRTTSQSNCLHKYLQKSRGQTVEREVGLLAIGEEEERVKDGSAHSCHLKKADKKVVPFDSKEERCKPVRPQTSLGPGSYEVNRTSLQRENHNRKKVTQSITKLKKNPPEELSQQIQSQKQQETKGKLSKATTMFNFKKDEFFGSTVSRFASGFPKDNTPGPGEYELSSVKSTTSPQLPLRKPAFGRSSQDNLTREVFISPFQVKVISNERPKNTKKKSVEGCFVFKEARFKEAKAVDVDSNALSAAQLFLGKENKDRQQVKKQWKHSSKLQIKREISKKPNSDDRPLSYAAEAFTISAKSKEKCQINAPFLSYVTRFNETASNAVVEFETLYCQSVAVTELNEEGAKAKASKSKGMMDSKNPRFNYRQTENQLCPFTYDPVKPRGKEFNRLFL